MISNPLPRAASGGGQLAPEPLSPSSVAPGPPSKVAPHKQHRRQPSALDRFPADLWTAVFQFLPVRDLVQGVALVSHEWRDMVVGAQATSWHTADLTQYGDKLRDEHIAKMSVDWAHLEVVNLTRCVQITDAGVREIARRCPSLRTAFLSHCPLVTLDGVRALAEQCPRLEGLDLTRCRGVNTAGAVGLLLDRAPQLKAVTLAGHIDLTDEDVERLVSGMYELRALSLECTQITSRAVFSVAEYLGPQLQYLNVSYCPGVTDAAVSMLARNCTALRALDLYRCVGLSDRAMGFLAQSSFVRGLVSLNLGGITRLTDRGLGDLAAAAARGAGLMDAPGGGGLALQTLCLEHCAGVTDAGVSALAACAPRLSSLRLGRCERLTDRSLQAFAAAAPRLAVVDLTGLALVTDAGVAPLARRPLERLVLTNCGGVTDLTLRLLGERAPHLRALSLRRVKATTDAGVSALAAGCPHLTSLDMFECVEVTDAGIVALAENCHRLQHLDLGSCRDFSEDTMEAMTTLLPNLKRYNLTYITTGGAAAAAGGDEEGEEEEEEEDRPAEEPERQQEE